MRRDYRLGYTRNHSEQPFQARPLPLLNQTTIVEQPTNLATISRRYTSAVLEVIDTAQELGRPFFLYIPSTTSIIPTSRL